MDDRYERCFICDDMTHRSGEDSIYIGVSGIGPWCESCYADMVQEVQGDARAEERALCNAANAANAPADPALLALARLAAMVVAEAASPRHAYSFTWDESRVIDILAHEAGVRVHTNPADQVLAPGIADAIAALLAPDGAAGGGVEDA